MNQVYWQHRALLEALAAAATALREQHRQTLAGARADVHAAEQTHREAVRACLSVAKAVLASDGHPVTPATLEAIRDTLHAVPTPEVNGRLTRPLMPRGLEALAGLVLAPRPVPQTTRADDRRARRDAAEAALYEARATLARADAAVKVTALTNVAAVHLGSMRSYAVSADGRFWVWGFGNSQGRDILATHLHVPTQLEWP